VGAEGVEIKLDPGTEGNMFCYSITPNNNVVIGSNYGLTLYNTQGDVLRYFKGHVSDVVSVAFSNNGRYMFSASYDQTIKVWDLNDAGKLARTFDEFMEMLINTYGKEKIDQVIAEKGIETFQNLYNDTEKPVVNPIANLFITNENEWIIWTDENYYASSKNGAKYVGFHVNHGRDSSASYYTFEQYDAALNRPDMVLKKLGTSDEETMELYYRAYQKRLHKLGLDETKLSGDLRPPTLDVFTENQTVTRARFGLNHRMFNASGGIKAAHVTINGVPLYGIEGLPVGSVKTENGEAVSTGYIHNLMHTQLEPGQNEIQMWCTSGLGVRSNLETRYVYFDTVDFKPDLYILGIGCSDYLQDDFDLKYAAKDVRDFVSFYEPSGLYNSIIVDTLLDENVNLENVKASIEKLYEAKAHDHVLIYFAGHGILTDELDYFLAMHNMDFDNPGINGLSYDYLENEIAELHSRNRTVFLDACHSGEIDKEESSIASSIAASNSAVKINEVRGAQQVESSMDSKQLSDLVNNTFSDLRNNSGATILASAGGSEFAFEGGEWENGVFTYCVLKGIKEGLADLNGDGITTISELQRYVADEVNKLTLGLQTPNARTENDLKDFVFWE
jgi:hypothetical protein